MKITFQCHIISGVYKVKLALKDKVGVSSQDNSWTKQIGWTIVLSLGHKYRNKDVGDNVALMKRHKRWHSSMKTTELLKNI